MSRVFITGDTHGILEIDRLSYSNFPEGRTLTKDDYVIVCGDFGLIWDYKGLNDTEKYWLNWLNNKPWTTLFIDGNHENFDRLNNYKIEEWHGGKVHKIKDSIIHLMRGQIYNINKYKWFTFGGAESIDRAYREEARTWWPQEVPSSEEYNEAMSNLSKVDFKVDYILTHAMPQRFIEELFYSPRIPPNSTPYMLNDFEFICDYREWYCGHYHMDVRLKENFHMLYHKIVEVKF